MANEAERGSEARMGSPQRQNPESVRTMQPASVELDDTNKTVLIRNLLVEEAEVHEYLSKAVASEHTGLLVRALRVGSVALRDAVTASKVDYVQREFLVLKTAFADRLATHFGPAGDVTKLIHEKFGDDGEVQARLAEFVGKDGELAKLLDKFLGEEGAVQALLGEDGAFHKRLEDYFGKKGILRTQLDHTFGEKGGQLYDLLSHNNEKGPVGAFMRDLNRMFDPDVDGSPMAQIRLEISRQFATLYKDFAQALGKAEEKQKGTSKGGEFQDWVFTELQAAAALVGDAVDEVGEQKGAIGKTGDILVTVDSHDAKGADASIIFEAKNKAITLGGKDTIYHELDRALKNRNAGFAVAVVHPDHAKEEIGPFIFRAPNMILCVAEEKAPLPLLVAYRLARTMLQTRRSSQPAGLDQNTLAIVVKRIQGKLTEFSAIYTQISKTQNDLNKVTENLRAIANAITDEVQSLLQKAEDQ